ncbi:DoxX family membrane protein [Flavitalea sp. BT771]|uniref:DoxX family membrane protein n=1 Tax=Flavitalea sp. BT771 TaxID=3063329 RepID=UPI0026E433B9|nr:DoxX family membrane protein [Flavitalea sp. BT771]MDO6429029.1 DoxX family membrane protein [Flavitalea sp. BT771]MDV6218843.1 DoxX family membrane protein [Flavitalea sp. BT771]
MKTIGISTFLLRIALASGFLSAVASRLGLWGKKSSGWHNFLDYTAEVNSFIPKAFIPAIAVISTFLEISLGILLLIGFKIRYAAYSAALLTLLFAFSMTYSFGIKEPLDYSVFAFSAGAFVLASMPHYQWSVDQLLSK